MSKLFLKSDVQLQVLYDDRTTFGTAVTEKLDRHLQAIFGKIFSAFVDGIMPSVRSVSEKLKDAIQNPRFQELLIDCTDDSWTLKEEICYPDSSMSLPRRLLLRRAKADLAAMIDVPMAMWPEILHMFSRLARGCYPDELFRPSPFSAETRAVFESINKSFVEETERSEFACAHESEFLFLGHNTVAIRTRSSTVVIDPYFFPKSDSYSPSYQPIQPCEVGSVDAVLITHSHPDHFDLGSLLRFPSTTQIVIPVCNRESALAIDMQLRLSQLGFENVLPLPWGAELQVKDQVIKSLPFYGEQPTEYLQCHPEVRNLGNTYLVRTNGGTALFLADSGKDSLGAATDKLAESLGCTTIDIVFSGYRGFSLYPFQYLVSSVPRYFLFVPPSQWNVRQRGMFNCDEAIDLAERLGAKYLIPYADGGAPWHWDIGLGPNLDTANGYRELAGFDYDPIRVKQLSLQRSTFADLTQVASPVEVVILRPNQSFCTAETAEGFSVMAYRDQVWPFGESKE